VANDRGLREMTAAAKVKGILAQLERTGTGTVRNGMARYGLVASRAFGVPMGKLLLMRKQLGVDQPLSLALWKTGWYEARLLASLVGDPARVTRAQMNAWARSFENWGDTDTVCFQLFDRTPHAWDVAPKWAASPREFVRRGGYVLMACLALHDKRAADHKFTPFVRLLEKGAGDERNFVKKGIVWAFRGIARRSPALRRAVTEACTRLAASGDPPSRWVGKTTLREMRK
jgi:3-methyladenine DNA glycosylase AlkD